MSTEPRRLGKYILREHLARGGQGEVWKAFDTTLRRYVAIKQLNADMQSDPDFASRFEREAQFIASLHHPNIVQIHDFQLVHTPDSPTTSAYMVMDYIEGPTLADYIRTTSRRGQFPTAADIVYIFTKVSLAIDYAHGKGMIHRDIKPANIILDRRSPREDMPGEPVLTDFGIARLQGAAADTTKVLGTPLYVSPEQAQGLAGDRRSDLYSLGIILYEITTGITPFRGESVMVILMQHFQDAPPPPALINPHIPPALSECILKSIAKDPDARFSSASAMTIAIAEALNVSVPAELRRPIPGEMSSASSSYPLQPSRPWPVTPDPLTPSAFQPSSSPMLTPPSAFALSASNGQTPATMSADDRTEIASFSNPGQNVPIGTAVQPSLVAPPPVQQPLPPLSRRKPLYIALAALLVVVIVGSGVLYAFFASHGASTRGASTPSSSSSVVGQVQFLSSPNASAGRIDEAKVTVQGIQDAPPGKRYYAWLQNNNDNVTPVDWPLTPQNGSLTSSHTDPQLLANRPYLFLITLESASIEPMVASLGPGVRLYYAVIPPTTSIQNSTTFDIRACPQGGTAGVCVS